MIKLYSALFKAQSKMSMPKMTGVGQIGQRRYNYATLSDVLDCVMPALREEGVWLTQRIVGERLETVAFIEGEMEAVLDSRPIDLSGTPQQQGSAETYAKRYALCTVFCLVGIDDDDGASASTPDDLKAAKARLWAAIKNYAANNHANENLILEGVQKRPDYAETVEFFNQVAYEYETS